METENIPDDRSWCKKLIDRLKSRELLNYMFSTHFWGPVANWGVPISGMYDIFMKSPKIIGGTMTIGESSKT